MEHIIIGAEFVIGIILGVIAIAAVGAIIGTIGFALGALGESITDFLEERKKANKKNKDNEKYYCNDGFNVSLGSETTLTVDWWDTLEERIKKEYPNVIDFEFTSVTYNDYNYVVKYSYTLDCVSDTLPLTIKKFIINEVVKTSNN